MAKTSIYEIKQELLIFLRNSDIISITDRGVTTTNQTGSFSNVSSVTVGTTPTLIKNVRLITVSSVALVFGDDYTVNYTTGEITFTSAQTGAYLIRYDAGSTDRVFPDYPQANKKISDFPRIGFDIISGATSEFGIGALVSQSEYIISITFYDRNQDTVEKAIATIRTKLLDNKKDFFYMPFLTVTNMGPLLITPFGQNKVMQRNQDIMVKFVFEDSD